MLKKYGNRTEFQKKERNLVYYLKKMGWFDEVINKIPKNNKNKNQIWTKKKCLTEAKKYKTRSEWAYKNKSSYNSAQKQKILDLCCSHMKEILKPRGFWNNLENCVENAKKYKTRTEWSKSNSIAYNMARKNGWLDKCCSHMKIIGHKYKRQIYMFEFEDKHIYIGLTFNIETRKYSHLNNPKSPVYCHIHKYGKLPKFKIVSDLIDVHEAMKLEKEYQKKYISLGYIPLYDIKKAGAIGSGRSKKWTLNKCLEIAKSFNKVKDWRNGHMASYVAAVKNKWLDECEKHMIKYNLKYTKLECIKDAKKYTYPEEWKKKSYSKYSFSIYHKFYDECTKHMKRRR